MEAMLIRARQDVPRTAPTGLEEDRVAESIEEVLEGGLGDAIQDRSIDHLADDSERRVVPCAHGELGTPGRQLRHLEVGVQRREQPRCVRRPPSEWDHGLLCSTDGIAQRQVDLARDTDALSEPDLREQLVPSMMRFPGEPRQPSHRVIRQQALDLQGLDRKLDEIAREHAWSVPVGSTIRLCRWSRRARDPRPMLRDALDGILEATCPIPTHTRSAR